MKSPHPPSLHSRSRFTKNRPKRKSPGTSKPLPMRSSVTANTSRKSFMMRRKRFMPLRPRHTFPTRPLAPISRGRMKSRLNSRSLKRRPAPPMIPFLPIGHSRWMRMTGASSMKRGMTICVRPPRNMKRFATRPTNVRSLPVTLRSIIRNRK
ncbi:hypothetical protein D3C86_1633730 [compost metagenome]